MRLFRRALPLDQAHTRLTTVADVALVQGLFRSSARRYMGVSTADLPALLADAPAVLLLGGEEPWGALLSGWRAHTSTWLRGLVLVDGIAVADGIRLMLPLLTKQLRALGLGALYYAGDEAVDRWLQPQLQAQGFVVDIDVIVYEKRDLFVPEPGNQQVLVRPAQTPDLATVLALDARCFDDQWVKGEAIIGPALRDAPFFVIAELDGVPCGYSFATAHFGGRLLHLVRIAVDPAFRGRGIGMRLMADLVTFAARNGAEAITLNTQADNYHAQRLYQSFGFRVTGERQPILRYDLMM
jgi:[ribosomal protein S18]-alanine N-acetyltransferase